MIHLLQTRAKLNQQVRDFFTEQDFLEVETPILNAIPGMEPHLTPFETTLIHPLTKSQTPHYLNTSPELQMKKLLGQYPELTKIFNITKVFRNGETASTLHNPEFTMIEWYRKKADYKDLMQDCENLIHTLAPNKYPKNFARKSVTELFKEHCNLDIATTPIPDDDFFHLLLTKIEPNLTTEPIFLYDYPASQAALAKKSSRNPNLAERFELYINRVEIANAFSELTDPQEQRQRLQEEQKERKKLGKTVFPIDEEFLASLESIKSPTAGIALGLDRLYMVILNKNSINDVILWPLQPTS